MRKFLPCILLIAGARLSQAGIIESISFDLSSLHPGSTLSGTFTLNDVPMVGDTASAVLTFSDPGDYSPMSLITTITIGSGTFNPYLVEFSPLSFTNLSGRVTPINTKDVVLTGFGFAQCASFPCTASGGFEDRSPAVFRSRYTITAAVPEPGYGLVVSILLMGIVVGRRLVRPVS